MNEGLEKLIHHPMDYSWIDRLLTAQQNYTNYFVSNFYDHPKSTKYFNISKPT